MIIHSYFESINLKLEHTLYFRTPVYSAANGVKVEWPEYDMTTEEYLEFKSPMSSESVKRRLKPGINELWNKLVPAYLETVEDVALATPEQTEADVKDEL